MSNDYHIRDAGDPRRYYTMIPNMVDDADLSVYAFRLYVHFKRVAGDDGTCWQSVGTLAKACKMSVGSIHNARKELEGAGLVRLEIVDNPRGGRDFIRVTIMDIWGENASKYSTTSSREIATSPHELTTSSCELATSPHEIKNNSIKKEPKKKIKSSAEKTPAEILTPVVDALAIVTRMDARLNYGRIAKEAKQLIAAGYSSETITDLFGMGGKWYACDWRGKKGQPPTLAQVRETIGVLPGMNGNGNGTKLTPAQQKYQDTLAWLDKVDSGEVKL